MSGDEVQAEISHLLREINERPEDRPVLYAQLHGKLDELRAEGIDVPPEIVRLEHDLKVELMCESQGR